MEDGLNVHPLREKKDGTPHLVQCLINQEKKHWQLVWTDLIKTQMCSGSGDGDMHQYGTTHTKSGDSAFLESLLSDAWQSLYA